MRADSTTFRPRRDLVESAGPDDMVETVDGRADGTASRTICDMAESSGPDRIAETAVG